MESVSKEMCDVKCGNMEEKINTLGTRVSLHGHEIDAVSRTLQEVSLINKETLDKLEKMDKRLAALEAKPQKRLDQIISVVSQWAILLVLGLLAAKIGL